MASRVRMFVTILIFICGGWDIAFSQLSSDHQSYTTKSGDTLLEIAERLGDQDFWKAIYSANSDAIGNSGFIEEGQVLILPASVTESNDFIYSSSSDTSSAKKSGNTETDRLERFRAAFDQLVKRQENEKSQESSSDQQDPALELGGFVLDETRSKMGRDFYNLFYQHWQAPQNTSNFTITISEQPSFGRGTQVSIKIDYEQIFNARLQPRYEYIEALSKQAVARCQRAVQQQASVREQLMGY